MSATLLVLHRHAGRMSDVYVEQFLPQFCQNLRAYLAGDRDRMINRVELET